MRGVPEGASAALRRNVGGRRSAMVALETMNGVCDSNGQRRPRLLQILLTKQSEDGRDFPPNLGTLRIAMLKWHHGDFRFDAILRLFYVCVKQS